MNGAKYTVRLPETSNYLRQWTWGHSMAWSFPLACAVPQVLEVRLHQYQTSKSSPPYQWPLGCGTSWWTSSIFFFFLRIAVFVSAALDCTQALLSSSTLTFTFRLNSPMNPYLPTSHSPTQTEKHILPLRPTRPELFNITSLLIRFQYLLYPHSLRQPTFFSVNSHSCFSISWTG